MISKAFFTVLALLIMAHAAHLSAGELIDHFDLEPTPISQEEYGTVTDSPPLMRENEVDIPSRLELSGTPDSITFAQGGAPYPLPTSGERVTLELVFDNDVIPDSLLRIRFDSPSTSDQVQLRLRNLSGFGLDRFELHNGSAVVASREHVSTPGVPVRLQLILDGTTSQVSGRVLVAGTLVSGGEMSDPSAIITGPYNAILDSSVSSPEAFYVDEFNLRSTDNTVPDHVVPVTLGLFNQE